MPGSEIFSHFFTADIRTHFFSADVVKKCALIAMHLIAEEGRGVESGCLRVFLERAIWAMVHCMSSGCMGLMTSFSLLE